MRTKNNRFDLHEIHNKKKKPFVLDGAIGSLIQSGEHEVDDELWASMINLTKPEVIVGIHKSYIDAGADIITTNTFRTNPAAVSRSNHKISQPKFVRRSVELALEARENSDIIIAGSNAPAEDCYQKERRISHTELAKNHKTHIDQLWKYGADVILNETQSHMDEIKIICEHCSENSIPFIVSLFFTSNNRILSGESLVEVIEYILPFKPVAIGFNCIHVTVFDNLFIEKELFGKWGFYLNCGSGDYEDKVIVCTETPKKYIEHIKNRIIYAPLFVGTCCGSSPHHTQEIRKYIDEVYRD